jgi:hypothetical protein
MGLRTPYSRWQHQMLAELEKMVSENDKTIQ